VEYFAGLMKILTYLLRCIVFIVLTLLTQVGGIVYLLNFATYRYTRSFTEGKWARRFLHTLSFLLIYLLATFLIVPLIAKPLGRVPLPMVTTNQLRPLNRLTCLLNRNYVHPELREMILKTSWMMDQSHPGTVTHYLDAGFPFINRFPMLPHLSHHDGKKLDLSFFYTDDTGKELSGAPAPFGYGICEEPEYPEEDMPLECAAKGYWRYSILKYTVPQGLRRNYTFDANRTRSFIQIVLQQPSTSKLFIEPHLISRMGLFSTKLRFHGCRAVRHDDHIHVQIK
jgi:hypothetical protein